MTPTPSPSPDPSMLVGNVTGDTGSLIFAGACIVIALALLAWAAWSERSDEKARRSIERLTRARHGDAWHQGYGEFSELRDGSRAWSK